MSQNHVISFERDAEFYHRHALHEAEEANYIKSADLLRRALYKEPNNGEYRLDLADIYAQMGLFERSNLELYRLLAAPDPDPEAYFGLACNQMALYDYESAFRAFQNYRERAPEGDNLTDTLDVMEELDDYLHSEENGEHVDEAYYGKLALDRGEYAHAVHHLKRALELDPTDPLYVHNNLSLAYYCMGDTEEALREDEYVLSIDKRNVHALCNKAMYLFEAGKKQEAEEILSLCDNMPIPELDDLYKLCLTQMEITPDAGAVPRLRELYAQRPYDVVVIHYLAACLYNSGQLEEALSLWELLPKIEVGNVIGVYYSSLCQAALEKRDGKKPRRAEAEDGTLSLAPVTSSWEGEIPSKVSMYYEYPGRAIPALLLEISGVMTEGETQVLTYDTPHLYGKLIWMLERPDLRIKSCALSCLAALGGPLAEEILRRMLLDASQSLAFVRQALVTLKMIGAAPPYYAYVGDHLGEVRINLVNAVDHMPSSYLKVLHLNREKMEAQMLSPFYVDYAGMLLVTYVQALQEEGYVPAVTRPNAWAAALEVMTRVFYEEENVDAAKVAETYDAPLRSVTNHINRISAVLSEAAQKKEEPDGRA